MLPQPMIICGHPRSGTSLLTRLCNSHPDISLCFEFQNFYELGEPYEVYKGHLRKNWFERRIVESSPRQNGTLKRIQSAMFLGRYLLQLRAYRRDVIDCRVVTSILHRLFPTAVIVGDKFPEYVFELDTLAGIDQLRRLVIFRSCLDVVQSQLNAIARGVIFRSTTPAEIASDWVQAIQLMQAHAAHVFTLRYEDLVHDPGAAVDGLANWLAIAPSGFRTLMVHAHSVGKHAEHLNQAQVDEVLQVAGDKMIEIGYEIG